MSRYELRAFVWGFVGGFVADCLFYVLYLGGYFQ
jgi:hypothetical protein